MNGHHGFSIDERNRKTHRNRKSKRSLRFERLDSRVLFAGIQDTDVLYEIGDASWDELYGILKSENFYFSEKNRTPHDDGLFTIRKADLRNIDPDVPPSVFPIAMQGLDDLVDFDANESGGIAAIARDEDFGEVVKISEDGDTELLVTDFVSPSGYFANASPSEPIDGSWFATLTINWSDNRAVDLDSIGNNDVVVVGPNGTQPAIPYSIVAETENYVTVRYAYFPSGSQWGQSDSGIYTISILDGAVDDMAGQPSQGSSYTFEWEFEDLAPNGPERPQPHVEISPDASTAYKRIRESVGFVTSEFPDQFAGSIDLRKVRISDAGQVAFAGLSNNAVFYAESNGGGAHFGFGYGRHLFEHLDLDIADNGNVVLLVSDSDAATVWFGQGDLQPLLKRPPVFTRLGGLTPDGTRILINSPLTANEKLHFRVPDGVTATGPSLLLYDVPTAQIARVGGSNLDGVLDPGERWVEGVFGGTKRDMSSSVLRASFNPKIASDGASGYWLTYMSGDYWYPDLDDAANDVQASLRTYVRHIEWSQPGPLVVGPPVLAGAFEVEDANSFPQAAPFVEYDSVSESFFVVSTVLSGDIIAHHVASGTLPEMDEAFLNDDVFRHQELEKVAREIAYWELRDPSSRFQVGSVLPTGYVVGGMYVASAESIANTNSTWIEGEFVAVDLLPVWSRRATNSVEFPPILAFRGTDGFGDNLGTNLNVRGVGYSQYYAMKDWFIEWNSRNTSVDGIKPILVGHSLGGALAQWFSILALQQPTSNNQRLFELVTFNSPGIARSHIDSARNSIADISEGATHYVVQGDFVSLFGEAYVPGRVAIANVTDAISFDLNTFTSTPRHSRPILNREVLREDESPAVQLDILEMERFDDVQLLEHPEFNYMEDKVYVSFLSTTAYTIFGENARYLVSRQRAELTRKHLGTVNWLQKPAILLAPRTGLPVFVYASLEGLQLPLPTSVSYDRDNRKLIVAAGTSVVATSMYDGNFLMIDRGHYLNSRTLQSFAGKAILPNNEPGSYLLRQLIKSSGARLRILGSQTRFERGRVQASPSSTNMPTFLMWTATNANMRFGTNLSEHRHFVHVRRTGDQWQVAVDGSWTSFDHFETDRIVAEVDLGASQIRVLGRTRKNAGIPVGVSVSNIEMRVEDAFIKLEGDYFSVDNPHDLSSQPYVSAAGEEVRILLISEPSNESAGMSVVVASEPVGGNVSYSSGELTYTPRPGFSGTDHFEIEINYDGITFATERIEFQVGKSSHQNPFLPVDVNRDFAVSPLDALVIINFLNSRPAADDLGSSEVYSKDVSGDAAISPVDALIVINYLNGSTLSDPEGESSEIHVSEDFFHGSVAASRSMHVEVGLADRLQISSHLDTDARRSVIHASSIRRNGDSTATKLSTHSHRIDRALRRTSAGESPDSSTIGDRRTRPHNFGETTEEEQLRHAAVDSVLASVLAYL